MRLQNKSTECLNYESQSEKCYEGNDYASGHRAFSTISAECSRATGSPIEDSDDNIAFRRQVNGIERYFLRCPNANVIVVAKVRGFISPYRLRALLRELRKKHPLLGARISFDSKGIAWFTNAGVPENQVHVEQAVVEDSDAWVRRADAEQRFRFAFDKGPLVRFTLLNYPETSHLVINCHHTICDVISITYLIDDILSLAGNSDAGLELSVDPAVRELTKFPSSASLTLFQRIRLSVLNRLWKTQKVSFDENDYKKLHLKYWSERKDNRILFWELTESQTSDFVSCCRKENVTVNSAIITAFVAAQRDIEGTHPAYLDTVSIPVDIRNRLRPRIGGIFGLYVSSLKAKLNYTSHVSFWRNAGETHKSIKRKLTNKSIFMLPQQTSYLHAALLDSIYFIKYGLVKNRIASLFLRGSGVDRLNTGLEISNIGQYRFSVDYGSLKLEAIFMPGYLSDFQEKCLRVISVAGKMFFTLTFWDSIIDMSTAEKIRDTSMAYLARATGWVS